MSAGFSRSLRALEVDRARRRSGELLVVALLATWICWFVFGRVTVYEVSDQARLEVASLAHPVAAAVGGQVRECRLAIGREVQAHDVLLVLDAESEQLALQEKRTRHATLESRLQALHRETEAERAALQVQRHARELAHKESQEGLAKAEAQQTFAEHQLVMLSRLQAQHAASDLELRRSRAEAQASQAAVRELTLAGGRIEQDRLVQEGERQARLAKLEREAVELASDAAVEEAAIRRLEHDIALRTLRAPVSGRVEEAAELPAGAVVRPGEKLGAIVPSGEPRAVAWFAAAAIGRVRPGQPARLRLEGFPWTQYGTVAAHIANVGSEAKDGLVRVELALDAGPASAIPLGHGLPGSAEVEIEQVSPAALVLRATGQYLGGYRVSHHHDQDRIQP
ncbi:MAG TPA: HlyD family efflux transporter periplasmic adaptor subunit [Gemmataceae bacterium]|nr:HlyD family efflux transporter periplasmic adaptor subunit [Gemmataceae bacterium]